MPSLSVEIAMASFGQTAAAVLSCIIIAGILGGLVNYFGQNKPSNDNGEPAKGGGPKNPNDLVGPGGASAIATKLPAIYYILLSIAAASTVPLLLYLIQSKISDAIFKDDFATELQSWFVFFGLCVLAAVFAQKYLEAVYAKLLQEMNQTKNTAKKALGAASQAEENSIKARGVADDLRLNQVLKPEAKASLTPAPSHLTDIQKKIFDALNDPGFPLRRRTLGGIMNDAELDQTTALSNLNQMKAANLVKEEPGERTGTGYYRWIGTPSGT